MKPYDSNVRNVGDTSRALILRNLLNRKNVPKNPAYRLVRQFSINSARLQKLARNPPDTRQGSARTLPPVGFRVSSGQTLRQEVRQRRSFRDQTGRDQTGIQFFRPEEGALT